LGYTRFGSVRNLTGAVKGHMEIAMRLAYVTFLAFAAAPIQAQPVTSTFDTVSGEQPVDDTSQADDVEFREDVNQRMTVPVHVGGSGPYRFLVDTGADRTAISRQVAARLDLESGPRTSLHAMTGASIVETAVIPNLELSRTALRVIDAPLLDANHMGADGILGVDSLRHQRVIFDFENRVMTIVPASKTASQREEGRVVVTGRLRKGRLIVTNAVADRTAITVVLDTGSEVSVGNAALRRRLAKGGVLEGAGPMALQSVTGDILEGEYTYLRTLKVGEVELDNLAIVFADAHTFKQLGLENRPALLLGMNALSAFKKVSIDFANKKLRVIFPDHGSREFFLMAQR
jgi:predicted aspartyl protease